MPYVGLQNSDLPLLLSQMAKHYGKLLSELYESDPVSLSLNLMCWEAELRHVAKAREQKEAEAGLEGVKAGRGSRTPPPLPPGVLAG